MYNIYRERKIVTVAVFERQTMEVFGWYSFSILFNFLVCEAFAGEALVLSEISFLILLSLVWTSDLFSHLTPKIFIFIEDSPGNQHSQLANQSQIILYTLITFQLVSQSNGLFYVCRKCIPSTCQILSGHPIKSQYRDWLIKDPSPCLVGEYFFSL